MIRRAFWTCHILESWFRIDLNLPGAGISSFEDTVALPLFVAPEYVPRAGYPEQIDYQYSFLGMIAIRRLIDRVHEAIYDASDSETQDNLGVPSIPVVHELTRQLDAWRAGLPQTLQWDDLDRTSYVSYDAEGSRPRTVTFVVHKNDKAVIEAYNADIVVAQLRCRFYYCRLMLYRPFLFKALHYPDQVTSEEAACAAECLRSCLLWPVCMGPPKDKKRLIPNVYVWTQSFLTILLVLRVSVESAVVMRMCEREVKTEQLEQSMRSMLDWFRDMRQVDGIAEWSWTILEPLYGGLFGES